MHLELLLAVVASSHVVAADRPNVVLIVADVTPVPSAPEYLQPVVTPVPLELFAVEVARLRGCDVGKPRNLARA